MFQPLLGKYSNVPLALVG